MQLKKVLAKLKGKKVVVLGDIMLDQYTIGDVTRISPEAPVPIVKFSNNEYRLGGAANAAANMAAFGCDVMLAGVVGGDHAGTIIRKELAFHKISDKLISVYGGESIVKHRVLGNDQQIVRIDHDANLCDLVSRSEAINIYKECITADVVIISDYNKGTISDRKNAYLYDYVVKLINDGVKVFVDTKTFMMKYRGATMFTPNLKELTENYLYTYNTKVPMSLDDMIHHMRERVGVMSNILVTMAAGGMTLYPGGTDKSYHQAAIPCGVADVSGAGDTVLASMVAGEIADLDAIDRLSLAAHAASIVVRERGTTALDINKLAEEMKQEI